MRLTVVGKSGREGQWGGWAISDGGDPRGDESSDIRLWNAADDPEADEYTDFWLSWEVSESVHGALTAKMDAANSPPTPEPVYHYYDETRSPESILAELGKRTGDPDDITAA